MISFLVALLVLLAGFFLYGKLTEKVFGPPVVFLWIVFGSILGGAVHDYMSGMISCRNKGASIAELSGIYLGKPALYVMRIFSILLLLLTGTVFVTSPASLIANLTPSFLSNGFWIVVILIYYVLATLLPIDKVIGKLYPIFGVILIVMAVSIGGAMFVIPKYHIPELVLADLHPDNLPIWPFMFITVACGAISAVYVYYSCVRRHLRLSCNPVSNDCQVHHIGEGRSYCILRSNDN